MTFSRTGTKRTDTPDTRPRVFFCHLGPPYLNDALAIRQGPHKLIVDGGLAMPWAPWSAQGARGASRPTVLYDLTQNLYEDGNTSDEPPNDVCRSNGVDTPRRSTTVVTPEN